MDNYLYIYDPKTGEKYELLGKESSRLLKKYINVLKKGGSSEEVVDINIFSKDKQYINEYADNLDTSDPESNALQKLLLYYSENIIEHENKSILKKLDDLIKFKIIVLTEVNIKDITENLVKSINNMIYLLLDNLYYKNVISDEPDKDMSVFLEGDFLDELTNKNSGFSEELKNAVNELLKIDLQETSEEST